MPPPNRTRTVPLKVMLSPDEAEELRAAADREERTLSSWCRWVLLRTARGEQEVPSTVTAAPPPDLASVLREALDALEKDGD